MNTNTQMQIFPASLIPLPNVPFYWQLIIVAAAYVAARVVRSLVEDKREVF